MLRLLITSTLLLVSIGFLGYSLYDGMRSDGIATITVNMPSLNSRHERARDFSGLDDLGSDIKSWVSDAASQATNIEIPDKIDDLVPDLATRVSELTAQATALLDPVLKGNSLKVTLGTDQVCFIQDNDSKRCQDFPSRVSDLLPAPFNELLDIDVPFLTTILTINVRICLIIALLGALILAVVFIVPFFLGLTLLQVIPGLRLAFEVAMFLLAMLPLLIAAIVTFSIPSILRNLDVLKVTNGDLVWCLGVTLAMMILSGISFFMYRCR
ncbi:hypothetical protein ACJZ2D_016422 [Fusarium nematophilum]